MKRLLPLTALCVMLLAIPAWSEDGDAREAELEQLRAQGEQLMEQGALDYERLHQALQRVEEEKAAAGAKASLPQMDQMAKRAQLLQNDIRELKKARSSLEEAKAYLNRGRFEAGKEAFKGAVTRWSAVHQRIVTHIGEAPRTPQAPEPPQRTPPRDSELESLRKEVRALRAEIQALRGEVGELKGLLQALSR